MDESGERKRKSFSGTTKQEVNKKMTDYITNFESMAKESVEANKPTAIKYAKLVRGIQVSLCGTDYL